MFLMDILRLSPYRAKLEELLKENYQMPGGEENIKCFFREEGFQTGISNMLKVLHPTFTASCNRRIYTLHQVMALALAPPWDVCRWYAVYQMHGSSWLDEPSQLQALALSPRQACAWQDGRGVATWRTGLQALEHDKANDLMFWASSYNLFVTWAANGQHPWDNLPGSHGPAATLEIGALRGQPSKVSCLVNPA